MYKQVKATEARMGDAHTHAAARFRSEDQTLGFVSQNVNGFGVHDGQHDDWFRAFRRTDTHGQQDIVILQETHLTDAEAVHMHQRHARSWGFRSGVVGGPLSFWAPATDRKGGVAILVNPYGGFGNAKAVLTDHSSPHFIAICGVYAGTSFLVVNVYAPHLRAKRERFYRALADIHVPETDVVLLGGDFNCTMDALRDRSYALRATDHHSPGRALLLERWHLMDALVETTADSHNEVGLSQLHHRTHTYRYTLLDGAEASARLDRWYTSGAAVPWVAAVDVLVPGAKADHAAVKLHLRSPTDPVRVKKPQRVYPPPACAKKEVGEAMGGLLRDFQQYLEPRRGRPARWHSHGTV